MPVYQFAIAAGWDQPLGSLTNVELLKPSDGPYFHAPDVYPGYDDGNPNIRGDRMVSYNGSPSLPWRFMSFWKSQRYYLYHTVNGDSNTGKVTIYTLTNKNTTYTRLNAIMNLPKLSQSSKNFDNIGPYTVTMTDLFNAS